MVRSPARALTGGHMVRPGCRASAQTPDIGLDRLGDPMADPHPVPTGDGASPAGGSRRLRRSRTAPVRIARIETVPMTPQEYDEAVDALAVLLCRYWREHPELFAEDPPA